MTTEKTKRRGNLQTTYFFPALFVLSLDRVYLISLLFIYLFIYLFITFTSSFPSSSLFAGKNSAGLIRVSFDS